MNIKSFDYKMLITNVFARQINFFSDIRFRKFQLPNADAAVNIYVYVMEMCHSQII